MKYLMSIILVCATLNSVAQTNFVKNGDFERYDTCPYQIDQLNLAKFWSSASFFLYPGEYNNTCSNGIGDMSTDVPLNPGFYQFAHSNNGLIALVLYYDKTPPAPPSVAPFNFRDYAQGRLYSKLTAGKSYCVSFWVTKAESYCYAHNKIGAYLDDGSINTVVDTPGEEITSVTPQVYTNTVIKDTQNWVKIEGSFVATGNESVITIGNFFKNSDLGIETDNCWAGASPQYSYYLFDDVSVVPLDLAADAGKDSHAELGKKILIGRVGDTTATAVDCKWYKKGVLIDSGAIISVNAGASVGAIDTYVVVQTICGLVKSDTVTVKTVPVGFREYGTALSFSIYPNPSNGSLTLTSLRGTKQSVKVYDLLGRVVYQNELSFTNNQASINLNTTDGVYILELTDGEGNSSRQRIEIRN